MHDFHIGKLVVVGVGLIGGSVAAALKRNGVVDRVVGVGRGSANMQRALSLGVIDEIAQDLRRTAGDADIVLVAVPVRQTEAVLSQLRDAVQAGVIVTDAGSTKGDFVRVADEVFGETAASIVPGHPIAGAERTGVDAAQTDLFSGKRVVLTPSPQTSAQAVASVAAMWRVCGAEVIEMTAQHHDAVFSAVSHLPHVLSYALVEMIASREDAKELFSFAASGFRDFTRIAGSSPEMWRDICSANAAQLLDDIDAFQRALTVLAEHIRSGDMQQVEMIFSAAANARNAWTNGAT
ncbi:MAG TPA: prephenate dehydrogenase/arogenate dehydrogenase family protein [Burkholderiales bacterium]|nr:prephenate dehydrogenase/arogenate dehydrogenase family protein [Burkholderiales bacterium]